MRGVSLEARRQTGMMYRTAPSRPHRSEARIHCPADRTRKSGEMTPNSSPLAPSAAAPAPDLVNRCRIVLTGGPGGGKTTAADLFRREIGDRVVIVPEAATLLFSGGFPRTLDIRARKAAQQAIFHVQTQLENVQSL